MNISRHDISDDKWARIEHLLPGQRGQHGGVAPNNRRFINAILYVSKTGIPWRDLPTGYGQWDVVYHRYNRWCKKGRWQAIFDANLSGAFFMTQAVAPGMKARRFGRVINISSGAGLGISLTGIQAYASAKAGQIGLTRQLAHELGPWNITVNNVAPGFVRSNPTTERQWEAMGAEGTGAIMADVANYTDIQPVMQTSEIVG